MTGVAVGDVRLMLKKLLFWDEEDFQYKVSTTMAERVTQGVYSLHFLMQLKLKLTF